MTPHKKAQTLIAQVRLIQEKTLSFSDEKIGIECSLMICNEMICHSGDMIVGEGENAELVSQMTYWQMVEKELKKIGEQ